MITRLCLVTLPTFLEVLSLKSHSTDEVGQQDHQSQQLCVLQFFSSCFCIFCEVLLHVKVNLLRIENFENYGDDEEGVERMLNTSMGSVELRSCVIVSFVMETLLLMIMITMMTV